jgi:hypothetical protein
MLFKQMYSKVVDIATAVQSDYIGKLEVYYYKKDYPVKLRRNKYYDAEQKRIWNS